MMALAGLSSGCGDAATVETTNTKGPRSWLGSLQVGCEVADHSGKTICQYVPLVFHVTLHASFPPPLVIDVVG